MVTSSQFSTLFNQIFSSRSNDELTKHFPILAWCRDDQLRLIDMDPTFRKVWYDNKRIIQREQADLSNINMMSKSLPPSSSSHLSRQKQQLNRTTTSKMRMDSIEDETTDIGDSDLDDNAFSDTLSPRFSAIDLLDNDDNDDDEHDLSFM